MIINSYRFEKNMADKNFVRLVCSREADFAVEGTKDEAVRALKDHASIAHNLVLTDTDIEEMLKKV